MRRVMVLVLSIGAATLMHAHADEAKVTRSRWIIILTISDAASGARLDERELDAKLEFDDLEHCKSVVTRVGPLPPTNNFRAALSCRRSSDRKLLFESLRSRSSSRPRRAVRWSQRPGACWPGGPM